MQEHYGKDDESSIAAVKDIYRELDLEEVYTVQHYQHVMYGLTTLQRRIRLHIALYAGALWEG